jgi:hypothetical protein
VTYESEPTRLSARSSRSILAIAMVVAIGIAVAIGGLTSLDHSAAVATPQPTGLAGASPVTSGIASGDASTPQPPAALACHGIDGGRCAAVARAAENAIRALDDPTLPAPETVDVWAALLCGSTFDCPPQRLVDRRPAGSVVVGFGGSVGDLWVNVTEIERPPPVASLGSLEAWVIRSGPS